METTDTIKGPSKAFAAAQRAYEAGRLRSSIAAALPVLILPVVSWVLSGRTVMQSVLGTGLVLAVSLGLWRGQALGRGTSLGLAAGMVPLVCAHAARLYGHVCTPTGCATLCVPACLIGGAAAGLIAVAGARRASAPGLTLATAGGVAVLTGSLGCACVGFGGVMGLVAGVGAVVLTGRLLAWRPTS